MTTNTNQTSDQTEAQYSGKGAEFVQQLFRDARAASNQPACLLFIDELDAVEEPKLEPYWTPNDTEMGATLSSILEHLDRLQCDDYIVGVINDSDQLDPAVAAHISPLFHEVSHDGPMKAGSAGLVVLWATNHPDQLDPAVSGHIRQSPPSISKPKR